MVGGKKRKEENKRETESLNSWAYIDFGRKRGNNGWREDG